jgi:hypothetical protein
VAHHGSHNGTPFLKGGEKEVLEEILSAEQARENAGALGWRLAERCRI